MCKSLPDWGEQNGAQSFGHSQLPLPGVLSTRASQQLPGECAPASPSSSPRSCPSAWDAPCAYWFFPSCRLQEKFVGEAIPGGRWREVAVASPAVLPFPENAGSLPILGLPGQLAFSPRATRLPPPSACPAEQLAILWATDTHCKAEG